MVDQTDKVNHDNKMFNNLEHGGVWKKYSSTSIRFISVVRNSPAVSSLTFFTTSLPEYTVNKWNKELLN